MTERLNAELSDLELVCGEIFERWDKDMRSGKLLTALSGLMAPGYDPRVDRIRAALAQPTSLRSVEEDQVANIAAIIDPEARNFAQRALAPFIEKRGAHDDEGWIYDETYGAGLRTVAEVEAWLYRDAISGSKASAADRYRLRVARVKAADILASHPQSVGSEASTRIAELEAAIRWALGEGDSDFGDHRPVERPGSIHKPYWWRTELRKRAGLRSLSGEG